MKTFSISLVLTFILALVPTTPVQAGILFKSPPRVNARTPKAHSRTIRVSTAVASGIQPVSGRNFGTPKSIAKVQKAQLKAYKKALKRYKKDLKKEEKRIKKLKKKREKILAARAKARQKRLKKLQKEQKRKAKLARKKADAGGSLTLNAKAKSQGDDITIGKENPEETGKKKKKSSFWSRFWTALVGRK